MKKLLISIFFSVIIMTAVSISCSAIDVNIQTNDSSDPVSISCDQYTDYISGDQIVFSVIANTGYTVNSIPSVQVLDQDCTEYSTYTISGNQVTFTIPDNAIYELEFTITVSITYSQNQTTTYNTITWSGIENVNVTNGLTSVQNGTSFSFVLQPKTGYSMANSTVSIAGTGENYVSYQYNQVSDGLFTVNVTEDLSITVSGVTSTGSGSGSGSTTEPEDEYFNISWNGTLHVNISNQISQISSGSSYTFSASPDSAWYMNNATVSIIGDSSYSAQYNYSDLTNGQITIPNITENITITFAGVSMTPGIVTGNFTVNHYVCTGAVFNSFISGSSFPSGTNYSFSVAAQSGYTISSITVYYIAEDSAIPSPSSYVRNIIYPTNGIYTISITANTTIFVSGASLLSSSTQPATTTQASPYIPDLDNYDVYQAYIEGLYNGQLNNFNDNSNCSDGSLASGFIGGIFGGLTSFWVTISNGIGLSGITLGMIITTLLCILVAVFIIKMIKG